MEKWMNNDSSQSVGGIYRVTGSFGTFDGVRAEKIRDEHGSKTYSARVGDAEMRTLFITEDKGFYRRKDTFINHSKTPVVVSELLSRFCFDGGEYETYTQNNMWQNESAGKWLPLHTATRVENNGIRLCDDAAPVLCLKNVANGLVTAFFSVPFCKWEMTARQSSDGDVYRSTVVETGFSSLDLALTVAPGEEIELPETYITESRNPTDFDAYKLHRYLRKIYPQKEMPVLYNTWLCTFDRLRFEDLDKQLNACAELGFETFVVDAGWFGNGFWWTSVGDWTENKEGLLGGRLKELACLVHKKGLKFGLWMEPERANEKSQIVKNHPAYFFGEGESRLLNFADSESYAYIWKETCRLVEEYGLDYMKFDNNSTRLLGPLHSGFYRYGQGKRKFFKDLKQKYPSLYLTGCAAGGHNMAISALELYDSFWLSDNQGPMGEMRIFKDTVKRFSPSRVEKWSVQTVCRGIQKYTSDTPEDVMICCNDGTWTSLVTVTDAYSLGLMKGSPMGFSCDLTNFTPAYREKLIREISLFKKERTYYKAADVSVLTDTGSLTVLEYADENLSTVKLHLFTQYVRQKNHTVFPRLNPDTTYRLGDTVKSGQEWMDEGVTFPDVALYDFREITLTAE
ncbi:MAG: alpha-galactosidase [Clostridia bacterium]|nr:alpha-galactosidase [Clostridia bacterium]